MQDGVAGRSVFVPTQKARTRLPLRDRHRNSYRAECSDVTALRTVTGLHNGRPDQDTDTATPGLNNESWSSSVAIVAPRGISKAITTLITLPGPMLSRNDALFGLA